MLVFLRVLGFLPLLMMALAMVELSQTLWRTGVGYGLVDPAGLARYRLYTAGTDRIVAEIEAAITERDYAYASSLYRIGVDYGHALPPDLGERAEGTWAGRTYASGTRVAGGFVFGSVDSGEAIVGSLASDLVGVGDVRDFSVQGFNYLAGRDYDPLLLGLSTIGLGLTAASYTSFGAAAAPDAGISIVKNAYRGGKISRPLTRYFTKAAGQAVDTRILKAELKTAAGEGVSGIGRIEKAAAKSLDRTAAKSLLDDVAVLDDMRRTGGIRTSVAALSLADGPKDLRRLQHVTHYFGDGSHAVFKFLGRSVLQVGHALVEILQAVAALIGMVALALVRAPLRWSLVALFRLLGLGPLPARALRPLMRLW